MLKMIRLLLYVILYVIIPELKHIQRYLCTLSYTHTAIGTPTASSATNPPRALFSSPASHTGTRTKGLTGTESPLHPSAPGTTDLMTPNKATSSSPYISSVYSASGIRTPYTSLLKRSTTTGGNTSTTSTQVGMNIHQLAQNRTPSRLGTQVPVETYAEDDIVNCLKLQSSQTGIL